MCCSQTKPALTRIACSSWERQSYKDQSMKTCSSTISTSSLWCWPARSATRPSMVWTEKRLMRTTPTPSATSVSLPRRTCSNLLKNVPFVTSNSTKRSWMICQWRSMVSRFVRSASPTRSRVSNKPRRKKLNQILDNLLKLDKKRSPKAKRKRSQWIWNSRLNLSFNAT